jgi:hypothetical protein
MENVEWIWDYPKDKRIEMVIDHLSRGEDSTLKDDSQLELFKSQIDQIIDKVVALVSSPQFDWEGKSYMVGTIPMPFTSDRHIFIYNISGDMNMNPTSTILGRYQSKSSQTYQWPGSGNLPTRLNLRIAQIDCTDFIREDKINKIL